MLVDRTGWHWTYAVSEPGKASGESALAQMARQVAKSLTEIADWVLALSVWELVLEIARRYLETTRDQLAAPTGPRSPDFDVFYFCFIAGVIGRRKESQPVGDAGVALVENFPGPYRNNRGRLLVSVFLSYELEDFLGVKMEEKKAVHSAIADLVDPKSPNHLTNSGVREFNRYAAGGFEVLLDWFDDIRPTSLDSFLRRFKSELVLCQSLIWGSACLRLQNA